MNTTHIWNSQTYQLEKEAVLLTRDTQLQSAGPTIVRRSAQKDICKEMCKDDSNCLEVCNTCKQKTLGIRTEMYECMSKGMSKG